MKGIIFTALNDMVKKQYGLETWEKHIIYKSPRKLCTLAIGLTKGAAAHFKVPINVQQPICMHKGADHCRLEVSIER